MINSGKLIVIQSNPPVVGLFVQSVLGRPYTIVTIPRYRHETNDYTNDYT